LNFCSLGDKPGYSEHLQVNLLPYTTAGCISTGVISTENYAFYLVCIIYIYFFI